MIYGSENWAVKKICQGIGYKCSLATVGHDQANLWLSRFGVEYLVKW